MEVETEVGDSVGWVRLEMEVALALPPAEAGPEESWAGATVEGGTVVEGKAVAETCQKRDLAGRALGNVDSRSAVRKRREVKEAVRMVAAGWVVVGLAEEATSAAWSLVEESRVEECHGSVEVVGMKVEVLEAVETEEATWREETQAEVVAE